MGARGAGRRREMNEARICPVHGRQMEVRASGYHCQRCERMGQHGQVVIAACPHSACGLGLLDITHCINGMPSVKIGWRYTEEGLRDGQDHILYVSSIWGDHTIHSDAEIKNGAVLDLFCPFCGREFPKVAHCSCNAKMVVVRSCYANAGGDELIQVCARKGCPEHRKIRRDEMAAVAGLQVMCGGGRAMDAAAMRVAAVRGNFGK
jgi:hypothetical protein